MCRHTFMAGVTVNWALWTYRQDGPAHWMDVVSECLGQRWCIQTFRRSALPLNWVTLDAKMTSAPHRYGVAELLDSEFQLLSLHFQLWTPFHQLLLLLFFRCGEKQRVGGTAERLSRPTSGRRVTFFVSDVGMNDSQSTRPGDGFFFFQDLRRESQSCNWGSDSRPEEDKQGAPPCGEAEQWQAMEWMDVRCQSLLTQWMGQRHKETILHHVYAYKGLNSPNVQEFVFFY